MKIRSNLAEFMIRSRLHVAVSYISNAVMPSVNVLAYHRIKDIDCDFKFDKDLVSATVDDFEKQVAYVRNHCNPISCDDLVESIETGRVLPRNSVLITFDDGFDDNYHIAYPILKQYSVPATFFITSEYPDTQLPYWFDLIYMIHVHMNTHNVSKLLINELINLGCSNYSTANDVLAYLKHVPNIKRQELISTLISKMKEDGIELQYEQSKPMSWDQIREMSDNGYDIGSHTVTHPVLSMCTEDEIKSELFESKRIIEKNINKEIVSIAYPVGKFDAYNQKTMDLARNAGYKIGFSYESGRSSLSNINRYSMKRLPVELCTNINNFVCKLSVPSIFDQT